MSNIAHNVLFVCIHNSARSQMAEAFLTKYGGELFHAESAGIEPGKLNPYVVQVMKEEDIDLTEKGTQSVFDLFKQGKMYNAVITVCDEAAAERCPIFPGVAKRISWSFTDPSSFSGTQREVLEQTRKVRDQIKTRVLEFVNEAGKIGFWLKPSLTSSK